MVKKLDEYEKIMHRKRKFAINVFFAFAFCIIFLYTVLVIIPSVTNNPVSNFNITLNYCHNETELDYYGFPKDYHTVICPDVISKVPCYDKNGNEIIGVKCLSHSYTCYKLNNESVDNATIAMLYLSWAPRESGMHTYHVSRYTSDSVDPNYLSYDIPAPVKKKETTIQVCEEKETDEIIIIGENLPLAHMYCPNGSEDIETCIATILKKELTISLLDKNCECKHYWNNLANSDTLINSKEEYEKMRNVYCNSSNTYPHSCKEIKLITCSKYSCGDYTVEVLK
jgi:hypothetical protein